MKPLRYNSDDDDGAVYRDEDFNPVSTHTHEPPIPKPSSQVRTIMTAVIATVAVIAIGWFGWDKYTEHKAAERTAEVTAWVKDSMQEKMASDSDFSKYGLTVSSVDLVKVGDAKYEGMAAVHTSRSSTDHNVSIEVIADNTNMMWKAKPGEFMWLAQEVLSTAGIP